MIGTLDKMLSDMKSGVYDFTKDGKCSQCGQCCSDLLPLSSKEIKEIKRYIEKHHIEQCKHFIPSTTPTVDMTCPFRDNEKRICTIYPVRPAICKDFVCSKPKQGIELDKSKFHGRYEPVDMRATFYGEKDLYERIKELNKCL